MPTIQKGETLPGGLTVVSVSAIGPDSIAVCFDCGQALHSDSVVVCAIDDSHPTGDPYVLHLHCVEIRLRDRLRYLSAARHAELFSRLRGAVDALTELNYSGGEFEELIDALDESFRTYRKLVEG
jgi:hypothetical protein